MAGQDELMLVERVFLRIGSAESDEQLQTSLGKFLTPVLLKLSSPEEGVRKKVMELLVHINKRLKSRPKVQLPIEALLTQYQDPSASPFITNFTLLYIKMGYPRLEIQKQAELIPMLINCLEGQPRAQQDSISQLLIPALQYVKFPSDDKKRQLNYGLSDKPAISKLLLDYMMDVLLLPYNAHVMPSILTSDGQARPATSPAKLQGNAPTHASPPPGLSGVSLKKVTGENPLKPEELEKAKWGILNFLGAGIFSDEDVVCHYIIAAADTRHSIATTADMELKRIMGTIDWNNASVITRLYSIFQGTVIVKGQATVKPEYRRSPASTRIRLKIFPYFLKSREATNTFPACIQVIFDCLYGTNTNAKLKSMAVQFVHQVCLTCAEVKFNPISPVLLSGIVKLIGQAKEDTKLRGLAYVAAGKIVRRNPGLVSKDITLVHNFFDAMCQEDSETRLAVQEALGLMADAFRNQDAANKRLMEALILQNIDKPEAQARTVAVQYAISVFPGDHIPSRYVLLLACGDVKDDIRGEASKALRCVATLDKVPADEEQQRLIFPNFTDMITFLNEKSEQRLMSKNKYVTGNHVLAFNPAAYAEIIVYLRMCLVHSAGATPNTEDVSSMQAQAPYVAKYINSMLAEHSGKKVPIRLYVNLIQQLLSATRDALAAYCLLEVVSTAPRELAPLFFQQLDWLKNLACSSKEDVREYASQLFAVVLHHSANMKNLLQTVEEFSRNLDYQNLEVQHGSALVLGYFIGYQSHEKKFAEQEMKEAEESKLQATVETIVKKLVLYLQNSNSLLVGAACVALGEIGRNGPIPLAVGDEGDLEAVVTKRSLVTSLLGLIKSNKETGKNKERAALCLGYLCVGDEAFPFRHLVMEEMMEAIQVKQMDLHLTIGEALVFAAQGTTSSARRNIWLELEEDFKMTFSTETKDEVEWYLLLLLKKYVTNVNPHIRQAACVWLLSLVKKCGSSPILQAKLTDIQTAFMYMLSESDDFTQDIASKGLALVYEQCSPEQKNSLVSELVETLMTGKRSRKEITEDTEVFEAGVLGKTMEGGNMSTYKELCSIASDLNQPDLIYKFLHLANHQANWNSKKGAAFGFTTIAAQAGEQLAPYLPKIVPKLYRYQFDPNPKVQMAMSSIWNALVQDSKTVDVYLQEIVDDLVKNLTSDQWRVRESSCLALNDLLRGRQLNDLVDKLPTLWETCLQVRDDIKESVRKAADIACRTLSRTSIKICDVNNGKIGEKATSLVLPCLLKHSLQSQVQEVRTVGLSTILKISKNAGSLLKPHIPILVIALLEAVSGLEPQVMNYLSLRASGSQDTQEKLDSARIAASKASPMMETVNLCVQYVDDTVLTELVPRLTELVKSGIGVGTKAGCASFIVSLVHQCSHSLTPHAGKLMGSLLTGLTDRNASIRKAFASALGQLVKVAKDSSAEKLMMRLKTWYLEKDEAAQQACGLTLHAMSVHSPDVLKRHAALVMPLVLFAMQEKSSKVDSSNFETTLSVWDEIWLEITPGTEAAIRLYLVEITQILQSCIESQSWTMKAQAAAAMGTVATKLGDSLTPPHLDILLSSLLTGLSGRTWTGKESLLEAIKSICCSCRSSLQNRTETSETSPTIEQVVDALIKECRKENMQYRMEGLKCVGSIVELYNLDRFRDLWDILLPSLRKTDQEGKDEDFEVVNLNLKISYQECVFEFLGRAWPSVPETQDSLQEVFCDQLCASLVNTMWKIQVSVLKTIQKFVSRLVIWEDRDQLEKSYEASKKIVNQLLSVVIPCLGNMKYSVIRSEAMAVITLVVNKISECEKKNVLTEKLRDELLSGLSPFAEDNKSEMHENAVEIQTILSLL